MRKLLFIASLFVSLLAHGQSSRLQAVGVDNRFDPSFNPLYYGAIADSSTDAAPAFQAMVNAIHNGAKRGNIFVPGGVYKFNSTVVIPADVRIRWMGAGSSFDTIITNSTTAGSHYGGTKIVVSSATIDAFRDSSMGASYEFMDFQNTNSSPTAGAAINSLGSMFSAHHLSVKSFFYGIEQQNSTNADISHVGFRDLVQYGLYTQNLWNSDIGDMSVSFCQFSCYFRRTVAMSYNLGSGGLKFTSCKWNGGGQLIGDCIKFVVNNPTTSSTDLIVMGSSLENFAGYGVNVLTSGSGTFGQVTIIGGNISSYNGGTAVNLVNSGGTLNHITIVGTVISNDNVGIVATSVDDLHLSGCSNTATTKYNFTSVTNLRIDDNASETLDGFMSAVDKKYLDSAVAAFFSASGGSTPAIGSIVVQDDFNRSNTSDISGSTPSPTSLGNWTNLYSSGFVPIKITSNAINETSGLATDYVATGLTSYDVSVIATTAAITGSGNWSLFGNLTDLNNFLFVQFNSANTLDLYQHIGGAYSAIAASVPITIANGDTLHLRTFGTTAYVLKNSTLIASGTYSPSSLTGTACGVGFASNTATVLDHFVVANAIAPSLGLGWAINHDNTMTGSGTPLDPLKVVSGGSYTLPTASPSVLGGVKNDNQTIGISSGVIATLSSSYSPTLTNTTNISSSTPATCYYYYTGSVIHMRFRCSVTPTATSTNSILTFTLPVSTTTTTQSSVGSGSFAVNAGAAGYVAGQADIVSGTTATFKFTSGGTAGSGNISIDLDYIP